jgi:hypothetical protein
MEDPPEIPPSPTKRAMPAVVDIDAAVRAVRQRFRAEYAQRAPELPARLIEASREDGIEAPFQYALLQEAAQWAAQDGDVSTALAAVARTDELFAVDRVRAKFDVLQRLPVPRTGDSAAALCLTVAAILDEAISDDRFADISRFASKADAFAKAGKDDEVPNRLKRAQALQREFAEVAGAHATLRRAPEDGPANLAFGRYTCFAKGDWAKGLPMLAQGSDAVLRGLAQKELREDKDSEAKLAICEGWLQQFRNEETPLRRSTLVARAGEYFDEIAPRLEELPRESLFKKLQAVVRQDATQADGRLELLRLVRPDKHAISGAWRLAAGVLESPESGEGGKVPQIWIPFRPPDEFDLELTVERPAANDALLVAIDPLALQIDAGGGSGVYARGQWGRTGPRGLFADGKRHTITIMVRRAEGVLAVDGRQIVGWKDGDPLSVPGMLSVPAAGGIVLAAQCAYRIHSARIREFRAKGTPLR